jgi:hypothetical protein
MTVDKKKSLNKFGIGNFSITLTLMIIFGVIGAIVGGWTGLGVGIVMPLATGLVALVGLVPFVGAFMFYPNAFNWFMDWLLNAVPSMNMMLGQGEVPRIVLFWVGAILATVATILMSILIIVVIIVVISALAS